MVSSTSVVSPMRVTVLMFHHAVQSSHWGLSAAPRLQIHDLESTEVYGVD
jgi:hypothetical protein